MAYQVIKMESNRNKEIENRELKRQKKEREFQQQQKLLSDISSFKRTEKPCRAEKSEEQLMNEMFSRKVAWGLHIYRSDIPLYLGGGEEYWI